MTWQAADYACEIRDRTLTRVGALGVQDMTGLTFTDEAYDAGSWSLKLPASSDAASLLSQPGAGIVVTQPDGRVFSGPVTQAEWDAGSDDELGEHWTFTGASDAILLGRCVTLPDPSQDIAKQTVEKTTWTGARDSLMLKALRSLQWQGWGSVTLPTVKGTGSAATLTADWQTVLESLQSLANRQWRFAVTDTGGRLAASIGQGSDLSGSLMLDTQTGSLKSLTAASKAPACTRVIVKTTSTGTGTGGASTTSWQTIIPDRGKTLEQTWGAVTKVVQLEDGETAASRATQEVAQAWSDMTSASGSVASDAIIGGATPGDTVGVMAAGEWTTGVVTSISTGFTDGVVQTASLGDWTASDSRLIMARRIKAQNDRISRIERRF